MVTPKSLASLTAFIHSPPITTGGNSRLTAANEIRSSLHLSIFNLTLFLLDHSATSSAILKKRAEERAKESQKAKEKNYEDYAWKDLCEDPTKLQKL